MAKESIPKVSVIAPVYGVENYIERAVESMMNQTLHEVEFIFVDDCTPDRSMEIVSHIVSNYPQRKNQVKYIRHNVNRGLPAARNTGLEAASGDYVFHWDSDDYAEPLMLESMVTLAETNHCDYVWADWFLTFETNSRIMHQPSASSVRHALTQVLAGAMKYNVWNKLVSRRLYMETGIQFPVGKSMGEDMTMIKLLAHAHRVGAVATPFYHYIRTNNDAMTQIYSAKHLQELQENTSNLCDYLSQVVSDEALVEELHWFKLNVKLPFLFSGRSSDMDAWQQWYRESHRYIWSNRHQAVRTRLLQLVAAAHLTVINRIYNSLVFKFIYGRIYK